MATKKKDIDFNSLAKQLEGIGKSVEGIQTDIKSVKTDINSVKNDITVMKQENKNMSANLTKSINDSVAKLKTEVLNKIGEVKEELQVEISGVRNQFNDINQRLITVESRVSEREPYQTDFVAVITGEPYIPGEDPKAIATNIVENGLGITGVEVLRAKRYGLKPELNRRGIIKAEFATKAHRDQVCDASKLLNDKPEFKHNYVNKCRTESELVQHRNAQKLIRMIPGFENSRVNWYGEIYEPSYRVASRGRGDRGRGRGGGRGRGSANYGRGGAGSAGTSFGAGRGGIGSAGTSFGAGRGGSVTSPTMPRAPFDGSVFTHPPPDVRNMTEYPNLARDAESEANP